MWELGSRALEAGECARIVQAVSGRKTQASDQRKEGNLNVPPVTMRAPEA